MSQRAVTLGEVVVREKISPPVIDALPRVRIRRLGSLLATHRLGFVHGAAGIGKTTALLELASDRPKSATWVRLDTDDSSAARLVNLLSQSLVPDSAPLDTIDTIVDHLEQHPADRLLIVDDLHTITASAASEALLRLLRYRPPGLTILVASRFGASADPTHRFLAEQGLQLDFEDLRFRLWEVDELVRQRLAVPMNAAELHLLSRYTGGWPAALRLFSVAARDASSDTRRRMIDGLKAGPGMAHEFLSQEMLAAISADEREFLVTTSVLEFLTPSRCDDLLETRGSALILRRLNSRGLFTDAIEATGHFRCHDLLRNELFGELSESLSQEAVNSLHRRAGRVAEREGALGEAVRYFARADDIESTQRIMREGGDLLSSATGSWWEMLPKGVRDNDPHVQLARARRLVRSGSLDAAIDAYERATDLFDAHDAMARPCRVELRRLRGWCTAEPSPGDSWPLVARQQLAGNRPSVRSRAKSHSLNEALDLLLAGHVDEAERQFRVVESQTTGLVSGIALFCHLFCSHLKGGPYECSLAAQRRLHHTAKQLASPALTRLSEALARSGEYGDPDLLAAEARADGDTLGEGLVHLLRGVAALHGNLDGVAALIEAARVFAGGEYGALALLANCLAAAAGGEALDADTSARARNSSNLLALLDTAATLDQTDAAAKRQWVSVAEKSSLVGLLAQVSNGLLSTIGATGTPDPIGRVQVLGEFAMHNGSSEVELELTPGHRQLLAYLCVETDHWVHRDRLLGTFWSEASPTSAQRSLQVAISNARGAMEAVGGRLEHDRARYRVCLPRDWQLDLAKFESLLDPLDDPEERARRLAAAQAMFADIVTDAGSVDWAVDARRVTRANITRATIATADELVKCGENDLACRLAEAGLDIDPSADRLWELAIDAAGPARSKALQARYDDLLDTLAIDA